VMHVADGLMATRISSLLEQEGRTKGEPLPLGENSGKAFIGSIINGMGFTMSPEDAQVLLDTDHGFGHVLKPYLGGREVYSSAECKATRWVVDFNRMSMKEAASYSLPFEWVRENVLPHRRTLSNKPHLQAAWWLYESNGTGWRKAVQDCETVLVITRVSKTGMPARVSSKQLFADSLVVFATDSYVDQAVLSSSMHQIWALTYGSGLRNDPRYTPSSIFETFPRPAESTQLERLGHMLEVERRETMIRRDLGFTRLYNLVNEPTVQNAQDLDVGRLRSIHAELDAAVMEAYGWADIDLDHGFFEYRSISRWTVSPLAREEILNRLLSENHRRAAHEAASGAVVKKVKKSHKMSGQEETLFT